FGCGQRLKTKGTCALNDVIQYIARRNHNRLPMLCPQVADTGSHAIFPWNNSKGGEIRFHDNVRKTTFPVTDFEVGKDILCDIPAKEDIALGKAIVQGIEKKARGDAFSPVDTFDV